MIHKVPSIQGGIQLSLILAEVILMGGCATRTVPPLQITTHFDEAKAKQMLMPGGNQIIGRVRFEMPDGTLVSCVGQDVSLVPATNYAKEWVRYFFELDQGRYGTMKAAYRIDLKEKPVKFIGAQEFYETTKTVRCDEDGEFVFDKVADGDFFVVAKVRWLGRDHEYYDFMYGKQDAQEQDGSVMERVSLLGKTTANIQWKPSSPVLLDGEGL